jgi:hypothetical protein
MEDDGITDQLISFTKKETEFFSKNSVSFIIEVGDWVRA